MPATLNNFLIWLSCLFIATTTLTLVANSQTNVDDLYGVLSRPTYLDTRHGYSINEIIHNHDLRHLAPSVDFQTINFRSGSAIIPITERWKVQPLADVIHQFVRANPQERFLIEGHTDAIGRFDDNLHLSELRADSVTAILTYDFLVPDFAIFSVGFGSDDLVVNTREPDPRNRRVTLRRITDLMHPIQQDYSRTPKHGGQTSTRQPKFQLQNSDVSPLPKIKPKIAESIENRSKSYIDL